MTGYRPGCASVVQSASISVSTQHQGKVRILLYKDTGDRADLEESCGRPPAVNEIDWRALLVQFLLCWIRPALRPLSSATADGQSSVLKCIDGK